MQKGPVEKGGLRPPYDAQTRAAAKINKLGKVRFFVASNKQSKYTGETIITELNDLRIIICLTKSQVTNERISVYNVIEKLMEHVIHCLPSSYSTDAIDLLP